MKEDQQLKLTNYMETAAMEAVEEVLGKDAGACRCERCKLDMAALVLNQLPARYVVHEKGLAYAKVNELAAQFKVDLTVAAMTAMNQVRKSPRH